VHGAGQATGPALRHVDHDLSDGLAVGDVPERCRRVVESERGADVRPDASVGKEPEQLLLVAVELVRGVGGEGAEPDA